ncbi:MAG: B3/B4 domain-containing protein [Bacteroidales bacterium]
MKIIEISSVIRQIAPLFRGMAISCKVENTLPDPQLWDELEAEMQNLAACYQIMDINKRPAILATRNVYKALGKDPNRYRPSAEALCRRVLKEKSLYKINTLVDLINLVSIRSGLSIGGFDYDKIKGDKLELGVGQADELFRGIGRGLLNIEGLPVYRDESGGIGTPTSDEERTCISIDTRHLLVILNGYDGCHSLEEAKKDMLGLLSRYANAKDFEIISF